DPGYQFRLQQGLKALDNSAASRGDLLSGNNEQAINQFGQDYASNEYGNVYNRALNNYQTNYNTYQQQQANTFNRLAAIAGIGQTAAGQLNSAGANTAGNVNSLLLNTGGQIGQDLNNAGAARASGFVGGANAITGGINGSTGTLGNLALLKSLGGFGGGSTATGGGFDPTQDGLSI